MPTGVYKRTKEMYEGRGLLISNAKRGVPVFALRGEHNPSKRLDVRAKISLALRGRPSPNKGKSNWWLIGPLNPGWKGGITRGVKKKAYYHMKCLERLAKKKSNGGVFTIEEWEQCKANFSRTCPNCGRKEPEIKLTVDHIVPITQGGDNFITNLQPLCLSCNAKKSDKIVCFCYLKTPVLASG